MKLDEDSGGVVVDKVENENNTVLVSPMETEQFNHENRKFKSSKDEEKLEPDIELERLLSLAQQQQHTQLYQQQDTQHNLSELQDAYEQQVISTEQMFEKSIAEDSKANVPIINNSISTEATAEVQADSRVNNTDLITDADNALGSIVSCINKCQALILQTDTDKALVSILCKLKTIKESLGNLLVDLAGALPLHSSNYEDDLDHSYNTGIKREKSLLPGIELEDYLVKAEIQSDDYDYDDNNIDINNDSSDYEPDKNNAPPRKKSSKKVKLENDELGNNPTNSKLLKCTSCDISFKTNKALSLHRKTCKNKKSYKCLHCNKILPNEKGLMIHISKKHSENKCDICNSMFDTKSELQAHRKKEKHYSDDQKVYCDKCDKVLLSQLSYKSHVEHFHSKRHECKLCQESFDAPKELREHLKNVHHMKSNKNFPCATCGSSFESIDSLRQHLTDSGSEAHVSYICDVCNNAFATEVSLKMHTKNRHSQKFECSECGVILDNKMEVRKHMASKHSAPKQSICQTCGYTTFNRTSFGRHLKIHGARKHKCEFCEKSFHVKFDLITHLRVHTGEKPYVCQVCGAAFSKNGGLSRHRKIHTGEKPFVCYLCGKGFNQRGNLKTHMKSHISGNLQPPKEQPIIT